MTDPDPLDDNDPIETEPEERSSGTRFEILNDNHGATAFIYPTDELTPRRHLELILQNAGTPFVSIERAANAIEELIGEAARKQSETMTAEAVTRILWRVPKREGAALRRVLLQADEGSIRDAAEANGCSKSSLHRREAAVRKKWDSTGDR